MEIYSYHYGADAGKGIGIRAQSRELENLPLSSFLKELSSLHALESSEHKGEKLCYLLEKDGYTIFGLSYPESPKESGYNRTAPCGLQYIVQTDVWKHHVQNTTDNFILTTDFKKPGVEKPEPLTKFPENQSFLSSRTSPDALAPVVDGLAKAALSKENEILLIALPKGIGSEYETARRTVGEAMNYLPSSLRKNIRFLTGLPVAEGETRCLTGFENAVRLNANVVFCPRQYVNELKVYRSFILADMDELTGETGVFAKYIVKSKNLSYDLDAANKKLAESIYKDPYEGLNQIGSDLCNESQRRKELQSRNNSRKGNTNNSNKQKSYSDSYARQEAAHYPSSGQSPAHIPQNHGKGKSELSLPLRIFIAILVLCTLVLAAFVLWTVFGNNSSKQNTISQNSFNVNESEINNTVTNGETVSTPTFIPLTTATPTTEPEPASSSQTTTSLIMEETVEEPLLNETEPPFQQKSTDKPLSYDTTNTPGLGFYNCYARIVNGDNVRLRSDPSKKQQPITEIKKGSYVWAVRLVNDDWIKVYYNFKNKATLGYIQKQYLEILSSEESEKYEKTLSSPFPQNMFETNE